MPEPIRTESRSSAPLQRPDPLAGWPRLRREPRELFAWLWAAARGRQGVVATRYADLAAGLRCSTEAVRRRLASLVRLELLVVEAPGDGSLMLEIRDPAAAQSRLRVVDPGPRQALLFPIDTPSETPMRLYSPPDEPTTLCAQSDNGSSRSDNALPRSDNGSLGGMQETLLISARPDVLRDVDVDVDVDQRIAGHDAACSTGLPAGFGAEDQPAPKQAPLVEQAALPPAVSRAPAAPRERVRVGMDEVGPLCHLVSRAIWPRGGPRLSDADFSLVTKAAWLAQNGMGTEWLLDAAEAAGRRGGRPLAYLHVALAHTWYQSRGQPIDTPEQQAAAKAAFNGLLKRLIPPPRKPRPK